MTPSGVILGYHGCSAEVAERAVLGKDELQPSRNKADWLGNGIYFWAHDTCRTAEWAAAKVSSRAKPTVLGGIIDLGHCLNLAEREAVKWVEKAYLFLKATLEKEGSLDQLPKNRNGCNALDRQVMETLHYLRDLERLEPYDTVIGYFAEGRPIYEGAELRHQNHLQICVRDSRQILGYFFPKTEGGEQRKTGQRSG